MDEKRSEPETVWRESHLQIRMPSIQPLGSLLPTLNLTKKEVHQVAQIAHSGLAKMISPLHTTFDGDLIFTLSYGKKKADVNTIGLLGEVVLIDSVKRAITKAEGLGIIPAHRDIMA